MMRAAATDVAGDAGLRPGRPGGAASAAGETSMSEICQTSVEQEPMGIVISRGSREESPPRLSAVIWAQADEGPAPPGPGAQAAA
jgi:hypothetical protein